LERAEETDKNAENTYASICCSIDEQSAHREAANKTEKDSWQTREKARTRQEISEQLNQNNQQKTTIVSSKSFQQERRYNVVNTKCSRRV